MTSLVDPAEIEKIVGIKRHKHDHYGRLVSAENSLYILHSKACVGRNEDLRKCAYSLALDENGIASDLVWQRWEDHQDETVLLHIGYDEYDSKYGYLWFEVNRDENLYSNGECLKDCDGFIKMRWSGIACDCGKQWFCL